MLTHMQTGEMFCLKNWKVYSNSIRIKISTFYENEMLNETIIMDTIDNPISKYNIEGLTIRVSNEDMGYIYIGTKFNSEIKCFDITIENATASIVDMGLHYMFINGVDAVKKNYPESMPFRFDHGLFTVTDQGFNVEFTITQTATIANTAVDSKIQKQTKDDIIGNIEADLKMLSYFVNTSIVKAEKEKLNALLNNAENLDENNIMEVLVQCEQSLLDMIVKSRTDIQQYRENL